MAKLSTLTRATGTITSDGTVPTANDTVTIGGRVYTWKAAPTTTADEVKIGSTVALSMANLAAAINLTGTSGTDYGSTTTVNVLVAAVATATTVVLTSKVPGTIANQITTTENGTHTSFGAATLTGGTGNIQTAIAEILEQDQVNSSVLAALLTIDGVVYTN